MSEILAKAASIQIRSIGILDSHIVAYQEVPLFENHRDPFDRILIVTAMVENFTIITSDPKFRLYQNQVTLAW